MLEVMKDQRVVKWSEKGDASDKVVELNYGNLKVFREEGTFRPHLLIGVDTSGSTGCICGKPRDRSEWYYAGEAGKHMWEIAAALSKAGTKENTQVYGYGSTEHGHLTVVQPDNGTRVSCHHELNRRGGQVQEHGGGTPELAMLIYLNHKAQEIGNLQDTTVVLIVDGQPDMPTECGEYADEMVKAGVQFGVVLVGDDAYTDYYSGAVSVHVDTKDDIDKALSKLFSLITERGIGGG